MVARLTNEDMTMAGARTRKNGEQMYVISPTVTEDMRAKIKRTARDYDGAMTATMRVAIELGLGIMEREAKKYEQMEDSKYEQIRNRVMLDGRRSS